MFPAANQVVHQMIHAVGVYQIKDLVETLYPRLEQESNLPMLPDYKTPN